MSEKSLWDKVKDVAAAAGCRASLGQNEGGRDGLGGQHPQES